MKKINLSIIILILISSISFAKTYTVLTYNKDPNGNKMAYYPPVLKINKGDTVIFVPTDKGHNAEAIRGATPNKIKFKSKVSKVFQFTFNEDGTYLFKCTPHYTMGMIGTILVGNYKVNMKDVLNTKLKPKSKQRLINDWKIVGMKYEDDGKYSADEKMLNSIAKKFITKDAVKKAVDNGGSNVSGVKIYKEIIFPKGVSTLEEYKNLQ